MASETFTMIVELIRQSTVAARARRRMTARRAARRHGGDGRARVPLARRHDGRGGRRRRRAVGMGAARAVTRRARRVHPLPARRRLRHRLVQHAPRAREPSRAAHAACRCSSSTTGSARSTRSRGARRRARRRTSGSSRRASSTTASSSPATPPAVGSRSRRCSRCATAGRRCPRSASRSRRGPTSRSRATRWTSMDATATRWCSRAGLQRMADWYVGGGDPTDPLASPLFGELRRAAAAAHPRRRGRDAARRRGALRGERPRPRASTSRSRSGPR